MARRLVMSAKTSRDRMTSYWWRHDLQRCRAPKLGLGFTIPVHPLSTH